MKKRLVAAGLMLLAGLFGCSLPPTGNDGGLVAVFDGVPRIFDSAVVYQGTVVGQVRTREWNNGITRVTIDLDSQFSHLAQSNAAVVANNGRLHWKALSGYGEPLSSGACINGFSNRTAYQWFKFKHLINNITMSAQRRAVQLQARSQSGG